MGGQLIIFLPDHDLICVTTADTQSIQGGNQQIYDALYEELLPYIQRDALPDDQAAEQSLHDTIASLTLTPLASTAMPETLSGICGRTFQVQMEGSGFEDFSVRLSADDGTLSFTYRHKAYDVSFGIGRMQTGVFPIYNLRYAASGAWLFDGTLLIKAHIIDAYVGCVQFQLSFHGDGLTLLMTRKEESLFQEFQGHLYCR